MPSHGLWHLPHSLAGAGWPLDVGACRAVGATRMLLMNAERVSALVRSTAKLRSASPIDDAGVAGCARGVTAAERRSLFEAVALRVFGPTACQEEPHT